MTEPPAKKPKHTQVVEPSETGVGQHWATQLTFALKFLKSNSPIRLEDLAIRSGVEALLNNQDLVDRLRKNDRVRVDEKTGLWNYKPDFALRSPADLLALLRSTSSKGGLAIKTLRDSYPLVTQAIETLEKEGKVLVARSGEENQVMKAVFLDEIGLPKPGENVDEEFKALWKGLRTPIRDELAGELRDLGLTSAINSNLPKGNGSNLGGKKKRKGAGSRKIKITNTHLKEFGIDLSKDYVPNGGGGKKK